MTTRFSGCRMANVSNKLVEDIFTDEDILNDGSSYDAYENDMSDKAGLTNNCQYRVYPLYEDDNIEISEDEMENAKNAMNILIGKYGFSKAAAAGMCGNIYKESTWRLHVTNGIGAFGLCQWLGDRKILLLRKYGSKPSFTQQMEYINYEWNNESVAKNHRNELMQSSNPKDTAFIVRKYFERPGENEADDETRQKKAKAYYDAYDSTKSTSTSEPNKDIKKDINEALFNAIRRSCQSAPINTDVKSKTENGVTLLVQSNNANDKLPIIFDMILNSEYYNYIQKLYWVYERNKLNLEPKYIAYIADQNPNINKDRGVRIGQDGSVASTENNALPSDANKDLLRALAKRLASIGEDKFKKEVPQVKDTSILDDYKPQDCDELFGSNSTSNNGGGSIDGFSGQVTNENMKKVLQDVSHYYIRHEYNKPSSRRAVKGSGANDAPFDSGKCTYAPSTWYNNAGLDLHFYPGPSEADHNNTTLGQYGMKMVWHGTVKQALELPTSSFRPGDVSTQYYYNGKGKKSAHGCMWTGKDWRSDFVQRTIMANTSFKGRDGDYSVCIWRHPSFQEPNLPLT